MKSSMYSTQQVAARAARPDSDATGSRSCEQAMEMLCLNGSMQPTLSCRQRASSALPLPAVPQTVRPAAECYFSYISTYAHVLLILIYQIPSTMNMVVMDILHKIACSYSFQLIYSQIYKYRTGLSSRSQLSDMQTYDSRNALPKPLSRSFRLRLSTRERVYSAQRIISRYRHMTTLPC